MKQLVLTISFVLSLTGAAFAVGTVNWANISFVAMTAQTNSTAFSSFTGGGSTGFGSVGAAQGGSPSGVSFYWELLFTSYNGSQLASPTSMAMLISQGWLPTGLKATNSNVSGRLAPVAGSTHATVPWDFGVTNSIMLVGWSANLGTTWAAVSNELANPFLLGFVSGSPFFGVSITGFISPHTFDTDPGAIVVGTSPTSQGLPIFSLNTQLFLVVTPEPSTLALAGLGGLGLLLSRRRK